MDAVYAINRQGHTHNSFDGQGITETSRNWLTASLGTTNILQQQR